MILLLLTALTGQAGAPCTVEAGLPATSLSQLPPTVQYALGRGIAGPDGIADRNEPFGASDMALRPLPRRRFVTASLGKRCMTVTLEHGGIAYMPETLTFSGGALGWKPVPPSPRP
ncbi:MAG TPA: hypothetical protein VIT92_09775 [Burkholderiaceae bacterium]